MLIPRAANLLAFLTVLSLLRVGQAAKCMRPSESRFLVPMQGVPDEWKATEQWHTGKYFPAPEGSQQGGILLAPKSDAARLWWLKEGESELHMILTENLGSILCTLIGAGLQVGWSPLTKVSKKSGYCHWMITVHPDDPSIFQMRNYELSEIPEIGPVYLNKSGLYFDYGSNALNDPRNHVDESWTWWKWEMDESNNATTQMSDLPDQCDIGVSGLPTFVEHTALTARSVGGKKRGGFVFTSEEEFARCGDDWFLYKMKCYRIFSAPGLPYHRTERVCRIIGGRVVLPENHEENQFVRALGRRYAPRMRIWIRATLTGSSSRPRVSDFKDGQRSLMYRPFHFPKRLSGLRRCAQISPRFRRRNWVAKRCGEVAPRVVCEREAIPTERAGSTRCGRIQFPDIDSVMSQIFHGDDQRVRIINGEAAQLGQLPWQGALRFKEMQEMDGIAFSHYCGAVLIDSQWVLSAAHCFHDRTAADFYVRLGDLNNNFDDGTEQEFDIEEVFIHEQYTTTPSHQNDIVLIKLNRTATFTKSVQPACLPTPEFRVRDGERCQVSGWGVTDVSRGQASAAEELQYVTIPKMPDRLCSARYNKWKPYFVKDLMFCAGYREGGKDSCSGDSGGPYVCRGSDGRYAVAGIVSFGIGCAKNVFPGVYANVRHYIPWITEKIRANGGGEIIS